MEAIFCQKMGNFIAWSKQLLIDEIDQKLKFIIPRHCINTLKSLICWNMQVGKNGLFSAFCGVTLGTARVTLRTASAGWR
jgi:hypothetical protein